MPLHSLTLAGVGVGDKGAYAIAKMLKVNTAMETLDLQNNDIKGKGARAIASALKRQMKTQMALVRSLAREHVHVTVTATQFEDRYFGQQKLDLLR